MVHSPDTHVYPVRWQDDHVVLIDQRQLPNRYVVVSIHRCEDIERAIRSRIVQGGTAIGLAAAYGLYLQSREIQTQDRTAFWERLEAVGEQLKTLRPDKENLRWAIDRLLQTAQSTPGDVETVRQQLLKTAQAIQAEDFEISHAIGDHGLAMLPTSPEQLTLLTYCNHGALATSGYGTSLGVVRSAWREGRLSRVYAAETRPNFQGARLTAWECVQEHIPVTVITDSMVAHCMQQRRIHAVLVGADRIAANGDTISKIGTYAVALAAKAHDIPFLVASTLSTVDFDIASGDQIPITQYDPAQIYRIGDIVTCPEGADYYNPGSDMTPAHLITAIITEKGAANPGELARLLAH